LKAQAVGNALYGLQGMSSECAEVRDVMSALAIKIRSCKEDLDAQHVGNGLYGLQGLMWIGNTSEFQSIINFLHQHASIIVGTFSRSTASSQNHSAGSRVDTKDLVTLCQSLTLFISEISESNDVKVSRDLETLNALIVDELACRKRDGDVYYKSLGAQSKAEKRIQKIAMKVFQDRAIEVHSNVYLFDLFESDLILLIPRTGASMNSSQSHTKIINIEVDGIHHRNEKKIMFCRRKDKYLKLRGVHVSRIDVFSMSRMKDIELEEWILRSISLV
jgi:hypothetical protein